MPLPPTESQVSGEGCLVHSLHVDTGIKVTTGKKDMGIWSLTLQFFRTWTCLGQPFLATDSMCLIDKEGSYLDL